MKKTIKKIMSELRKSLDGVSEAVSCEFVNDILKAKRIFVVGSGRSGLVASGFAMRLMQIGMKSYVVGEPTTPRIGKKDILVVVSGSGETETVYDIVQAAGKIGKWCITARKNSRIAKKCKKVIIRAKTKTSHKKSVQPLGSEFEQAAMIYLDSLIVMLMKKLHEKGIELEKRHTILE